MEQLTRREFSRFAESVTVNWNDKFQACEHPPTTLRSGTVELKIVPAFSQTPKFGPILVF